MGKDWPQQLPSSPPDYYPDFKEKGGWGGFLGNGKVATHLRTYCSYEEASAWVRSKGLFTGPQWKAYFEKNALPSDIPRQPWKVYGEEFYEKGGMGGFFGTGNVANANRQFRPLSEVSVWMRENSVLSGDDWFRRCQDPAFRPADIPACLEQVYPEQMREIGGWPGLLGRVPMKGTSLIELMIKRALHHTMNAENRTRSVLVLESGQRWAVDVLIPDSKIVVEYDGVLFHKEKSEKDIEKTRQIIEDPKGWRIIRVREEGLPLLRENWDLVVSLKMPYLERVRATLLHILSLEKSGILSLADDVKNRIFKAVSEKELGCDFSDLREQGWKTLDEAAEWARSKGIKSSTEWIERCRDPYFRDEGIPSNPQLQYKEEFARRGSWGWFLGTGAIANKNKTFLSLEEASRWARCQCIRSQGEWYEKMKQPGYRPAEIPASPSQTYGKAFLDAGGWGGFLGTGRVATRQQVYLGYEEASAWAIGQGVKTQIQWMTRCKDPSFRPDNIPTYPQTTYKSVFNEKGGWGGFLGTGNVAGCNRVFKTYEEARVWAAGKGIRTLQEWRDMCRKPGARPQDIPFSPDQTYKSVFKTNGGWRGFLGTRKSNPLFPCSLPLPS